MSKATHKHIPGLDGIRAIAFLFVYISHAGLGHSYTGGNGVAIFFFLSGYLITTLMRVEYEETSTVSIEAFYIRRVFRIFPTLYVTVLFAILLHSIGLNNLVSLRAVSSIVFYYSNYFLSHHGDLGALAATWSLSVEEHFYLVFPLMYLAIARLTKKSQVWILSSLCLLALIWRCVSAFALHFDKSRNYLATDTRFDSILIGAICALALNPLFDRIPGWFTRRPGIYALLGVFSVLVVDHIPGVNRAFSFTILAISLFPVFWYAIMYAERPSASWLQNDTLRLIGRWSYALYLVHQVMIQAVEIGTGLKGPWAALASIVPCLVYAWAVEKFIEKPSYRLRNRILKRRATKSEPKAPTLSPLTVASVAKTGTHAGA
jgi:peptidoglycan/LPS O-acetylase OafA/YrhL